VPRSGEAGHDPHPKGYHKKRKKRKEKDNKKLIIIKKC